jgi:hypothetical protein
MSKITFSYVHTFRSRRPPRLQRHGHPVSSPGRGVDHPPHPAPRLKKEYSYTSTSPVGLYLYSERSFSSSFPALLANRTKKSKKVDSETLVVNHNIFSIYLDVTTKKKAHMQNGVIHLNSYLCQSQCFKHSR